MAAIISRLTVNSHEKFYAASGDSQCDIFRCIENGKLYVPCANELFRYNEPPQKKRAVEEKPTLQEKLSSAKEKVRDADAEKDGRAGKTTERNDTELV